MRHYNIPIFIPHLGCPNNCVFCNQRTISGVRKFEPSSVKSIIEDTLRTIEYPSHVEIAFFGGSFTGIDRALMIELLEIANIYVKNGKVDSIRCSTRPDYIDEEILSILNRYNVSTIELGLQSVDDSVLTACQRGHDFMSEVNACKLIVDGGFDLVGQMMIGLPGSDLEKEIKTADFIIRSGAVGVRIYPTVVFKQTELHKMSLSGSYTPLTLDDAIYRSAVILRRFIDAKLNIIRIGLCDSENLHNEDTYFAGPNHSALGELVINELYYNLICEELDSRSDIPRTLTIEVPAGAMSKAVGQNKRNKQKISEKYGISKIRFIENKLLDDYNVLVT